VGVPGLRLTVETLLLVVGSGEVVRPLCSDLFSPQEDKMMITHRRRDVTFIKEFLIY